MKAPSVALVSKSDVRGGGASRVAGQLHALLNARGGYSVDHWTAEVKPAVPRRSLRGNMFGNFIYRAGRVVSRRVGLPDFLSTALVSRFPTRPMYDLYHVHDISDAVSPITLNAWSRKSRVVWTFHDCSPFTGGCIYPMDCGAFVDGCHDCPQLGRWPLKTSIDRTGFMQRYKVSFINTNLDVAICPSRWVADQAALAGVRKDIVRIIPNAVDTTVFRPRSKPEVREQLGLPSNVPIVLMATMTFSNPYKGTDFACAALAMQKPGLNVLLIGLESEALKLPVGPNYIVRDRTFDRDLLARYYAACDLILFPSMADNCPLALLEALASGLPAVTFDSGGIGEIVEHGVNGWLAPRGDLQALAHGLATALDERKRAQWSSSTRRRIMEHHTQAAFLQAHVAVYEEVLARGPVARSARSF